MEKASISGLKGLSYLDKTLAGAPSCREEREEVRLSGWTDRVYLNSPDTHTIQGVAGNDHSHHFHLLHVTLQAGRSSLPRPTWRTPWCGTPGRRGPARWETWAGTTGAASSVWRPASAWSRSASGPVRSGAVGTTSSTADFDQRSLPRLLLSSNSLVMDTFIILI